MLRVTYTPVTVYFVLTKSGGCAASDEIHVLCTYIFAAICMAYFKCWQSAIHDTTLVSLSVAKIIPPGRFNALLMPLPPRGHNSPLQLAGTKNKATQAATSGCCVTLFSFRVSCG